MLVVVFEFVIKNICLVLIQLVGDLFAVHIKTGASRDVSDCIWLTKQLIIHDEKSCSCFGAAALSAVDVGSDRWREQECRGSV